MIRRARGRRTLGDGTAGEVTGDGPPTGEQVQEELAADEVARRAAPIVDADGRRPGALRRLYRGETSFSFVDRRRWWLAISGIVILAGVVSLGLRGLNLGITFKGGTAWTVKAPGITQTQAVNAVQGAGLSQPTVEVLGNGTRQTVRVTADLSALKPAAQQAETTKVIHVLAQLVDAPTTAVSVTTVGPTWGGQVTNRAIVALVVFLVLVAIYISIRFEPKMAIAAFVALVHDLLVTAGIYSLAGFQVSPDTVIAVLTILGYSLYDTVVVFDRVRDNTKGLGSSGRMTYSEMVDLSMNQTLARSINTSLVAILPVLSVLLIGAELLGATTLQNYGLALVVGLVSGAYSSIFIASPILAWLKEREPRYAAIRQRLAAKGDRLGHLSPIAAAALLGGGGVPGPGGGGGTRQRPKAPAGRPGTLRPGQARGNRGAAPARPAGGGAPARPTGTGDAVAPGAATPAATVALDAGNGTASPAPPEPAAAPPLPAARPPGGKAKPVILRPGQAQGRGGTAGAAGATSPGATSPGATSPGAAGGPAGSARRAPPRRKGGKGKKRR